MLSDYFKEVEEESVRDNFVICYELLDEMVDFGYPQTTDAQILQVGSPISSQYCEILTTTDQSAASIHMPLQEYITQEGYKLELGAPKPPPAVTNAVSWRDPEGGEDLS